MSGIQQRLARAARLIGEAADDDRGDQVPQALLDGLGEVVPGWCVCFHDLEPRTRRSLAFQSSDPRLPHDWGDAAERETFWRLYPQMAPLRYLCAGNVARAGVLTLSDFTPDRLLVRTALYQEYLRPRAQRYAIVVPIPALPGRVRGFTIFRGDSDFTEADRALLALLRPHLQAAHHARRRRRDGLSELTARQWQVLRCLAQGQSTEQIAASMCVSTSTVRKHLENAFVRLGVTSRAAAIGRAFAAEPTEEAAVS